MQIDITLKNYRCFPDTQPARISIRNGFTAVLGTNNAGKSTLLRFFWEFRNIFGELAGRTRVPAAQSSIPVPVPDPEDLFYDGNDRDIQVQISWTLDDAPPRQPDIPVATQVDILVDRQKRLWFFELKTSDGAFMPGNGAWSGSKYVSDGRQVECSVLIDVFQILSGTLYIGPFRNAINIGTNNSYFDLQIGQAFIQAWRGYKTGHSKKNNEAAYKLTQDIRRVFGFEDLEINAAEADQTLQVFVDGRSYKLPDLGAGIAQFILVLATAATRNPSLILIDEPELNLHPSLQLDFLTTLASYARVGVIFATHSVGLARASAERIYTVRKPQGRAGSVLALLEATPRLSELLGELSFSGYRELGFDTVLLVEGTTDVKTLQQWLRLYAKDHRVVLVPLGGSGAIKTSSDAELEEIKRICTDVVALIDSEKSSANASLDGSRQGFHDSCQRAGIRCHVLERRALENYLTDAAIKRVKSDKYRSLQPYELLDSVSPAWAKSENWLIAQQMTVEDLKGTDLGGFLESL